MALNGNRLFHSLNGKPTFGYFFSLSSHRLRLPLYAIKGEARMSLNATTPPRKTIAEQISPLGDCCFYCYFISF